LKRAALDEHCRGLEAEFRRSLADRRSRVGHIGTILAERNPLAILNRGYSITRDASGRILRDAGAVSPGSDISVRLARGELGATVQKVKP
jgi:exodeoxyribonuclease VII large subunit